MGFDFGYLEEWLLDELGIFDGYYLNGGIKHYETLFSL